MQDFGVINIPHRTGSIPFTSHLLRPGGNDANVKLLLHFDGNFTDSSSAGHNGTANGGAATSTTQKKFGSQAVALDGTGDYVTVASHADFTPGAGNFTFECWLFLTALPTGVGADASALWSTAGGAAAFQAVGILIESTDHLTIYSSANGTTWGINNATDLGATGISTGAWNHIAVVRSGTTVTGYVNGTSVGSGTMSGTTMASSTIYIGGDWQNTAGSGGINGYMDEVRYSNIARWTANFTPDAAAYY